MDHEDRGTTSEQHEDHEDPGTTSEQHEDHEEPGTRMEHHEDVSMYPQSVRESLYEAMNLQQHFYELSSDWNYYEKDQHTYLKQNIKYSIFGAPKSEPEEGSLDDKAKQQLAMREQIIETIYQKILEASRNKDSLYVGTIFNVLCNLDKKEKGAVPSPIFKVKRCMERNEFLTSHQDDPTKNKKMGTTALYSCCVYYIDSEGRIYKNWTDYITSNTVPQCLMVVPMGGFYQPNPNRDNTGEKSSVWLEIGSSVSTATKILTYADYASAALGVGALGVGLVAIAAPIAAPVAIAGTVCGAVSGLYTTGRSTHQLVDRHEHQQSIAVTDKTARSAWLGVAGGVAGGLASGSTFLLNKAARAGMTVGNVTRTTYNTIAIGNIVINGVGIGNGIYGIYKNYKEQKEFSVIEIGQVMAHLLFFGNTVMNFQTARTIITNSQRQVIQDYEQSLRSNRHRRAFNRIRRNTQASSGDQLSGDSEIIRGIRSIQNTDDFFAGVVRDRKIFNAADAEVTFRDGYAMINDNVKFDPMELSQQPKEIKINTVQAAEPFVKSNTKVQTTRMEVSAYNKSVNTIQQIIDPIVRLAGTSLTIDRAQYVGRLILELKEYCCDDSKHIIVKLSEIAMEVVKRHRTFVNETLEKVMHLIWSSYVRPKVDSHLEDMGINLAKVPEYPLIAQIVRETIMSVIDEIYDGVENFLQHVINSYTSRSVTLQPTVCLTVCSVCSGHILQD